MRIACPSCAAAYEVPESLIVGGQSVRCARCAGTWTPIAGAVVPPPPPPPPSPAAMAEARRDRVAVPADAMRDREQAPARAAPAVPPPHMAAIDLLMAAPATAPPDRGVRVAWVMSLALLAAVFLGSYFWRTEIMRAWPPSERLYATLGVAGPAR